MKNLNELLGRAIGAGLKLLAGIAGVYWLVSMFGATVGV